MAGYWDMLAISEHKGEFVDLLSNRSGEGEETSSIINACFMKALIPNGNCHLVSWLRVCSSAAACCPQWYHRTHFSKTRKFRKVIKLACVTH